MSTATPNQSSSTLTDSSSRSQLIHNVSLGAVIVCPIIMLLPPRKLDIYTVALMTGMFVGGNQLSTEYTGVSIMQRFGNRMSSLASPSLPPKALEVQIRLREEKERREAAQNGTLARLMTDKEQTSVMRELEKKQVGSKEKGLLEKVWLGGEGDDWKAKRDRREKEALEEGKGYGDLIMEQIWEVWNWGKTDNEEVKDTDKTALAEPNEKAEGRR